MAATVLNNLKWGLKWGLVMAAGFTVIALALAESTRFRGHPTPIRRRLPI